MSLDIRSYADCTEMFDDDAASPWIENVVVAAVTAFMPLCVSSVAILMYFA